MIIYLDDTNNGFINYNQFKFLLVLLSTYSNKQESLESDLFKKYHLNIDFLIEISGQGKGVVNLF